MCVYTCVLVCACVCVTCVRVSVSVWKYVHKKCRIPRRSEVLDPLEVELETIVSHLTWVPGTILRPSAKQYSLLMLGHLSIPKLVSF